MKTETSNIKHPTPNIEPLSRERLSQFRGDLESLRSRNQRFAQMLLDDFEVLIVAAEELEQLRRWYRNELDTGDDSLCNVRRLRAEIIRLEAIIDSAAHVGYGKAVTAEIERLQTGRHMAEMDTRVLHNEWSRVAKENEQLKGRIDQLTEYLRHGPNCPADIQNLTGLVPGKCDCGLMELVAGGGK